ncbi:hypothetical protein H4R24_005291 [Coemansia sp. RSA 988]|nr:hypothetical protein H4R24_005291 [Coemansia sp. RSA 988]
MSSPINYSPLGVQPISIPRANAYLNASPLYQYNMDGRYNSAPIANSRASTLTTSNQSSVQNPVQPIRPASAIPPHLCNGDFSLGNSTNQYAAIFGCTPSAEFDGSYASLNSLSGPSQYGVPSYPSIPVNGIYPATTHSTDPSMDIGSMSGSDIYATSTGASQEPFYMAFNDSQPAHTTANTTSVFGTGHHTPSMVTGQLPSTSGSNESAGAESLHYKRTMPGDSPNSLSNVPLIEHSGISSSTMTFDQALDTSSSSGTNPMLDFYILQQQSQQQMSYSMPNFQDSTSLLVSSTGISTSTPLAMPSVDDSTYSDLMSQFGMLPSDHTAVEANMDNFINISENGGYSNTTDDHNVQQPSNHEQMDLDASGIPPELTISSTTTRNKQL